MNMKKAKKNKSKSSNSTQAKNALIVIDKKLDTLSNKILFPKKLAKANKILSASGVPA